MSTLTSLNYLHVLVAAVAGFLVGWVWYSALFGKIWSAEMKITEEMMKESKPKMPLMMAKALLFTFISTAGLAMVLALHPVPNWVKGAEIGAAVGLLIVGARILNGGIWERKSCKLSAINVGHEAIMFAVQGAILAAWA
ncbi:MAG TPA: DUF1761 domain-containing protein [Opitutaceae bacterium]|nr:DUF1761 domain-containing protein [Opitutaceae bacterium]